MIRALSDREKDALKVALLLLQDEADKDTMVGAVLSRICQRSYVRVCKAQRECNV